VPGSVNVCVPIAVQVTPSADREAVTDEPTRSSFSHAGAAPETIVAAVVPPVLVRRWNWTPLLGVTSAKALRAPAASDSRIITPALVDACTACTLGTRETITPSPVIWRYTNMN
jgi:hypothetical protein